jgi:hypothetical protein
LENLKVRDHLGPLNIDGRILIEYSLKKLVATMWTGFMWLRKGPVAGFYKHGNEPSGSIKCGEFLDWVSDF